MASYKLIIKHFLIYSTGAIILRIIMALSLLITVRFVTPDQFGILALLNNLMIFLPILLGLGLRQVLAIEFFNHKNSWQLVLDLLLIYLLFALPTTLLLVWQTNWLNTVLFFNQLDCNLIILVIITSALTFLPELLFQLLRFQNKAFLLTSLQIGMGLLLASSTTYFVYNCRLGITGAIWAQFMTQVAMSSLFLYLAYQNRSCFKLPNPTTIITYLKTGLPFVPNILFAWLIMACNRWLLNWHLTLTDVGIYSLAENISLIFQTLVTQPLMHSYLPYAFQNFTTHHINIATLDRQYNYFAYCFILFFSLLIPIGLTAIKPILALVLTDKYLTTIPLLIPLLMAQIVFAATYITSASLQYLKKTYLLALFMGFSAIISIALNLWLMPRYGVYSCLIATNLAYLFYFGATLGLKHWLLARLVPSSDTNQLHRQT